MEKAKDIIDKAYLLFSRYKPGEDLDACTICCMKESEAATLKSMSLKSIPQDLLTTYQDAARPEELNVGELKYFAPRYLELILNYNFPSFEPLLSLNRFSYLRESHWTKEERGLLDEFAALFFTNYLNTTNKEELVSPIDVLLMFHNGKFNVENLLKIWKEDTSPESLLKIIALLEEAIDNRGAIRVRNAFSDEKFNSIIVNWLSDEDVKVKFLQQIEKAIMHPPEIFKEADIQKLSWNYEFFLEK